MAEWLIFDGCAKEKHNGEWVMFEFAGVARGRTSSVTTSGNKRSKIAIDCEEDNKEMDQITQTPLS